MQGKRRIGGSSAGMGDNLKKAAARMLAFTLLLAGCAGAEGFIPPGTHGTRDVAVTRGIVSDGALFVQLDKRVNVKCTVGWAVSGEEVGETDLAMRIEGFRMALQDAMDGLTAEGAWADDVEDFVAETARNASETLSDDDISVSVEKIGIERIADP